MKKFLLFFTILGTTFSTIAQKIDEVNFLLLQKKYTEAKAGLDKLLMDPKQAANPEALFLKGSIYNELSRDAKLSTTEAYNNKNISFDSYKKYLQLDKKAKSMTDQANFPFLDLYAGFMDIGAKQFGEKNFGAAFTTFVKTQEVEDLIFEKGYTYTQLKLNKIDTALIINTAAAAVNNKDTLSAVKYYTKLVDAGVNTKDDEAIYDFVVRYYMEKADSKNFSTNLAKAQKIYPSNPYWTSLEMDYLAKNDKPAMFAKYDANYVKDPADKLNTLNYGIELYNRYYDNKNGAKDSAMSAKLISVLKQAVKNGDETNNANVLLANHLYNTAAGYSEKADAIKSVKPADVKRKKDLISLSVASLNDLIPFALNSINYFKALPTLKQSQKANYRSAAGYLSEAYKAVKNVAKATEYDKLYNSISLK